MRNKQNMSGVMAMVTASSLFVSSGAWAWEADALEALLDGIWDKTILYENPDNPYIQKLAFTGRVHLDYSMIVGKGDPAPGVTDSDLSFDYGGWRRLRGGFDAKVFDDFTLHAEADFNPDEDPVYRKLTNVYIGWKPCGETAIKVGKQSMNFTLDGTTSSNELATMERNNLTNNLWFTNEHAPGVTLDRQIGKWYYGAGVFSQGEEDAEFGNFDAGTTWLASLGYDLSGHTGAKESVVAMHYVFNEETPANPTLFTNRSLGNIFSLNFRHEMGDFGFRSDLAYGDGYLGQSDLWGFVVMPYYNINDKLQAVFRYTFIESDSNNGMRFARYESEAVGNLGDQYQEAYIGLNYFIHFHQLKLQTGLQYLSMRDKADDGGAFDGLAWTSGIRLSW